MTVSSGTRQGNVVGVYEWHHTFPSVLEVQKRWGVSRTFAIALLAAFRRASLDGHGWTDSKGRTYFSAFQFKSPTAVVHECVHDHVGHDALETPLAAEKLAKVDWTDYASLYRDGMKVRICNMHSPDYECSLHSPIISMHSISCCIFMQLVLR